MTQLMKLNKQQKDAWKKVEGCWKYLFVLSFLIAAIAQALASTRVTWVKNGVVILFDIVGKTPSDDFGLQRAFAYFVLEYLIVVPAILIWSLLVLKGNGFKVTKVISWYKKVGLTLAIPFATLVFAWLPFLIIISKDQHYWRTQGFYNLLTGSYIGLALTGWSVLYAVIICSLASFSIPLIWRSNPTKEV